MKGMEEVSETMIMKKRQVNYQTLSSKQWLSGSSVSSQRTTRNYKEITMNSLQNISTQKKEIKSINKGQEEMKNTMSELKKILEWIKSRLDKAEDQISELEDKVEKDTQKQQEKE